LDTVVVSETFKRRRDPGVVDWLSSTPPEHQRISAMTIAEIEVGIERQRRRNRTDADDIARWLESMLRGYGDRVLALDVGVARRLGRLAAQVGNKGWDLAIAATALEHGLTVVTRNVRDFQPTGVPVLNPFRR
jgi:predicted nucleic acid-binding protein